MRTSANTSPLNAYTPAYQKRRTMPVPRGFVAVLNEQRRHPLVHVVQGDTFGEVARRVMRGLEVKTLCEKATISAAWSLIGRNPEGGYLVSCAYCRARMLEGVE